MAWADDRDGSAGYVTVTTLATAVDEAVPFCVVYLSDMPADFWTAMDAASDTDGKTIRTSTSDGTTQLACVPIGVNTSTDTGCLIFLGTGMSASVDVDYRIYVGNASLSMPTASGGMGEQAVFAAYAGVYFPGVDTRDWTSGGRTLTAVNSPGTAASGLEGITAATYTSGSSQYHKYEGAQAVSAWPVTIEAIAQSSSNSTGQWPFALGLSTATQSHMSLIFSGEIPGDLVRSFNRGASSTSSLAATSSGYTTSTNHYIAASRSGGTGSTVVYRDGGNSGTESTTISSTFSPDRLSIGARVYTAVENYLNGRVAVALLSSSVRSADYVSTMQDNWNGTMYSAGAWTALDSDIVAGSTGWVLFQTAGQSTSADADWTSTGNAIIDDSTYAYADLESGAVENSEYLNLTNPAYGTTIPTGAPSYTVEFRIKRYRDTGGGDEIQDLTVQFIDDTGTRVGDNKADTVTDWPTSAGTVEYTITGVTPDGTEFTSAAGLAFRATGVNGAFISQARVLTAWIRVSWTGTDAAYNTRGFFALTE